MDPSAKKFSPAIHLLGACAALMIFTCLVFSRSLGNDFVNYDDPTYITNNSHVQDGLTLEGVRWALGANVSANWHPLTLISHEADWSLFNNYAYGHHTTSVLLHALNAVLVFLVFRRLTGSFWTSAINAALFACHPLRVESVTWISERKDVLSGFFAFLAIGSYTIYAQRYEKRATQTQICYLASLVFFAAGLASKPMVVTLPAILLLLDMWPLGRRLSNLNVWVEKAPFIALSLGSCVVTYLVQEKGGAVASVVPMGVRLANAFVSVPRYLIKCLWPSHLAPLYPLPPSWPFAAVCASVGLVSLLIGVAFTQRVRRPWIFVGVLWFLGMLVPVSGLIQVGLQSMADRYTYLPVIGLQVAVLWTAREWILSEPDNRSVPSVVGLATVLVVLLLGFSTWRQIGFWKNSGTLWQHTIEVTKNNAVAYNNLGTFDEELGNLPKALLEFRRAVEIDPKYVEANNNLGQALTATGYPADAIHYCRRALELKPDLPAAQVNLAEAFLGLGRPDDALREFGAVLARNPETEEALRGKGMALAMKGDGQGAIRNLNAAVSMRPKDAAAHGDLGIIYTEMGLWTEAIEEDRRAIALKPNEDAGHCNLAVALQNSGHAVEAADEYQTAIRLEAYNPEAHANLGLILFQTGHQKEAIAEMQTALKQDPKLAWVHDWLTHQASATGK